jgi:hypothetical protein
MFARFAHLVINLRESLYMHGIFNWKSNVAPALWPCALAQSSNGKTKKTHSLYVSWCSGDITAINSFKVCATLLRWYFYTQTYLFSEINPRYNHKWFQIFHGGFWKDSWPMKKHKNYPMNVCKFNVVSNMFSWSNTNGGAASYKLCHFNWNLSWYFWGALIRIYTH